MELDRPILIGISGWAGSGKDTFADILVDLFGFKKMSFADALREIAEAVNPIVGVKMMDAIVNDQMTAHLSIVRYRDALQEVGYTEAKSKYPEMREFLQRLGTDGVRTVLGNDTWINEAMKRAKQHPLVVFPDLRFQDEAAAVEARGGCTIRITRPGVGPANDHISEHDLDDHSFHAVVENNGTVEDLSARAEELYEWLATLDEI